MRQTSITEHLHSWPCCYQKFAQAICACKLGILLEKCRKNIFDGKGQKKTYIKYFWFFKMQSLSHEIMHVFPLFHVCLNSVIHQHFQTFYISFPCFLYTIRISRCMHANLFKLTRKKECEKSRVNIVSVIEIQLN